MLSQANGIYGWSATKGTVQSGQGTNTVNIKWNSPVKGHSMEKITNNNSYFDSTNLSVNNISVGGK